MKKVFHAMQNVTFLIILAGWLCGFDKYSVHLIASEGKFGKNYKVSLNQFENKFHITHISSGHNLNLQYSKMVLAMLKIQWAL